MRRVVVTGVGMLSPIGNSVEENFAALLEGKCGVAPIRYYDTEGRRVKVAAELKNLDLEEHFSVKELRRRDRFVTLALLAAKEAMADSGITGNEMFDAKRVGCVLSTGVGGLGTIEKEYAKGETKGFDRISPYFVPGAITNIAAAEIAIAYGLKGFCNTVVTACAGGTNAIGEAYRSIKDGYQDAVVCGGSESCISEFGIGGFTVINALSDTGNPNRASIPFDAGRNGFVMGEGAGILVLEELEHAKRRGAKIYAEVTGYAANCDAHHVTSPLPDGEGAADCMLEAMKSANLCPEQINYINAHGTSTKMNDSSETRAVKKAFGEAAYTVPMSSTKSMTGHLLGASGAVEAIYTVLAVNRDYIPPTIHFENPDPECDLDIVPNEGRKATVQHAMTNSLGFGGHNASLIFSKYPR